MTTEPLTSQPATRGATIAAVLMCVASVDARQG